MYELFIITVYNLDIIALNIFYSCQASLSFIIIIIIMITYFCSVFLFIFFLAVQLFWVQKRIYCQIIKGIFEKYNHVAN